MVWVHDYVTNPELDRREIEKKLYETCLVYFYPFTVIFPPEIMYVCTKRNFLKCFLCWIGVIKWLSRVKTFKKMNPPPILKNHSSLGILKICLSNIVYNNLAYYINNNLRKNRAASGTYQQLRVWLRKWWKWSINIGL